EGAVSAPRPGLLLALEGIDGAGKSTLAAALVRLARRHGVRAVGRREPNDPELGRRAQAAGRRDAWIGAVYFTVDRAQARPALERALATHDLVVSDRSFYSTLAYQGSALGPRGRRRIEALSRCATVPPDRVILLDLPARAAVDRLGRRGTARGPLERRRTLERVAAAYRDLARRRRWTVLDARAPPAELAAAAWAVVERARRRPARPRRT
ncbi:Thymidylate kinase, partial [mine drainage metagenome]